MNPKLQARMAHVVDGKAADQRPAYYDLIKFAVQKEAEINFNEAKKTRDMTSKLKVSTHFHFNQKKSGLPVAQVVWMLQPLRKNWVKGRLHPFCMRRMTVVSHMSLYRRTQLSPRVMWKLLSDWLKHLRH